MRSSSKKQPVRVLPSHHGSLNDLQGLVSTAFLMHVIDIDTHAAKREICALIQML